MSAAELHAVATELRRRYPEPPPGMILELANRLVILRALADALDAVAEATNPQENR